MKIDIKHIILLAAIALFVWLWLSKPTESLPIPSVDTKLLKQLKTNEVLLIKSDSVIDSLIIELSEANLIIHMKENALKILSKEYDRQIKNISDNSVLDDIELFKLNFIKDKSHD